MSNPVGLAIEQTCFCVEETVKGTAVFPSAAAEMVAGAGVIEINQQPSFSNSEEIINSLDVIDRFQDQVGPGIFNIPTYLRPSGTAGTSPAAKMLFESLMGLETIVGATSVTYEQATTKPSFTIWVKKSHTVFFGTGACVDKGAMDVTNKGGAMFTFSGGFMQLGWAGTDAVNGATANGTGTGYLVDLVAGYEIGDTEIHLDTGADTILEGDTITFVGDANVYFVTTGFAGDGDGDIVIASPGLVQTLADGVAMTITGNRLITVVDGKKFTAGARVRIAADNNTKAGYEIESVSSNVLTMTEAVTAADEAVVAGYLDETLTVVGTPLESRETSITIGGVATNLKRMALEYNSPAVYQVDEITTSGYPEDYVEDTRGITGTLDLLFRQDDLGLFYDGLNNTSNAIIVTINDVAGSICTINLPYAELEVPAVSSSKPTVDLSIALTALGSSGEDSSTIVFT